MRTEPALSVVVVATDSLEALLRTIASLGEQSDDVEVIVAAEGSRVRRPEPLPPGVVWLAVEPGLGVAGLRRRGLDRARGEVVAFTEDSCVLSAGWTKAWLAAFRSRRVLAATGPVVPAMGERSIDRAIFFCEYAPFLPERRPRSVPERLAGNNFAVRRAIGSKLDPYELHEWEVRRLLGEEPQAILLAPRARAGHVRGYSLREALGDRLRFGRDYGRRHALSLPCPLRFAGLFVGPAILLSQAGRLLITVAGRAIEYPVSLLETLPITIGLLTAWSVGEWLGWMSASVCPEPSSASRKRHERAVPHHARPSVPARWPRPRYKPARSTS